MGSQPPTIGPYEVVREIARGSLGTVYEGLDRALNRRVAIKTIPRRALGDDEAVERFQREMQAVARLRHPNLIPVLGLDQEGETLYVVMEYFEGSPLEALMRSRRLTLQQAFTIFKDVSLAIEHAHRNKLTHRAINPRNVLVSEDLSRIKVIDLGVGRIESTSDHQSTISMSTSAVEMLRYVAPEQAAHSLEADSRSDVYSLGVLLYLLLTGEVPIRGFNLPSRLNNDVPPEVDPIVMKCLATDPRERYQNAGELAQDIQRLEQKLHFRVAKELQGLTESTGNVIRRSLETMKRPAGWLSAAGLILVMAVLGIVSSQTWRNGDSEPRLEPAPPGAISVESSPEEDEEAAPGDRDRTPQSIPAKVPTASEAAGTPRAKAAGRVAPADSAAGHAAALQEELGAALDKLEAGNGEQALAETQAVLEKFSDHPDLADAYLQRGRIQERLGRLEDAMATYLEMTSRFAEAPATAESKYRYAQLSLQTRKGSELEVRALYGALASDYPESPWAPPALAAKAAIEKDERIKEMDSTLRRRVPAALVTYRTLVDRYPQNEHAENGFWSLAEMYEDLRLYELAAGAYTQLGENFPDTGLDAWWRAGQISQKRLKDNERARAAYERVPETSRHYQDARNRAARLAR